MQLYLKSIAVDDLTEMLIKHTEYYMTLCNSNGDLEQRKTDQKKIDIIIAEIKSGDSFKDLFPDNEFQE